MTWVNPFDTVALGSGQASGAYGQTKIPAQTTPSSNRTWVDLVSASIDIPSAGVWALFYSLSARGNGQWFDAALTDAANNQVVGSQGQITVTGSMQSLSRFVLVTTTGPATYKLRIMSYNGGTATIFDNNPVTAEDQGQSVIGFFKIG